MKKNCIRLILSGVLCLSLAAALAGCSGSPEDSDVNYDGAEMDVEFLTGEYADQLINDGADTVTGSVSLISEGDSYKVVVEQKQVVVNENYEDGYYIADRNMTSEYEFGADMGIVVMENGEPAVSDAETFQKKYSDDPDALYTVYLMGDTVELILPLDPRQLVNSNQ